MNRLLIILSTIVFIISINAQNADYESIYIYDILNEISDEQFNEQDINNLETVIRELKENPVNINNTNKEELSMIPFLNDKQIESILYYVYLYAPLKSIYELLYIENIDRNIFRSLIDLVYIGDYQQANNKVTDKVFTKKTNNIAISCKSNINNKTGYVDKYDSTGLKIPSKSYLNNKLYTSVRYTFEDKNRLKIGFVMEKDPGEKVNDFISGYINIKNYGAFRNIILGNYKARFGLGLCLNNSFGMGKGFYSSNTLSRLPSVSPHNSVDEYNYLSGAVVEMSFKRLLLTLLISYKSIDGIADENIITSIKTDGLHSKVSDLEKIKKASLLTSGFSMLFKSNVYNLGINFVNNVFNNSFEPTLRPYNVDYFRGDKEYVFSVYNKIKKSGFDLSSEIAASLNSRVYNCDKYSLSTINSLSFYFTGSSGISFIQRYYEKGFHSLWGRSYSESSGIRNEHGYSVYFYFPLMNDLQLKAGGDYFKFPQIKYGIDKPSDGYDLFCKLESRNIENIFINISYRYKHKKSNDKTYIGDTIYLNGLFYDSLRFIPHNIIDVNKHQGYISIVSDKKDFNLSFVAGGTVSLKNSEISKGIYLSGSLSYQPKKSDISGNLSFTVFSTDDYNSRVYVSERSLPYNFGFNSLSGEGLRYALNLKYDFLKIFSLWIKFSNTHYFDIDEFGTGLETIKGRNKTDIAMMLRCKF